ncbi:MAG: putative RNA methylase [Nitrosopumilales archaeon]|nr:MAG: putative RNA methylase [Nitrosopumilales archaeon]
MPDSFFVLSKDNLELAKDEIIAIAKTYDRFAKAKSFSNLIIIQSRTPWEKIAERASFVKTAGQVLKKMSNLFLDDEGFPLLLGTKTFACRVINLSKRHFDVQEIENTMGNLISKFSKAKVCLENPALVIYLIFTNSQSFFGFSTKFDKSKPPKKVKNHPHELDSKLCRAMINLAGFKEGETICDPFCGTGTTLLQAESMGMRSIGIDFDKKMCEISKQNLKENQFNSQVVNADYTHLKKIMKKYDGVVTDLPYGRASKSSVNPEKLLQNLVSILPRKKRIAIMCKKGSEKGLDLNLIKKYEIYRHKSLTRTILIK